VYCLSIKKKKQFHCYVFTVQHKLQYFPEILLRSVLCKKVEIIKTTPYGAGFFYYHLSVSLIVLCFRWLYSGVFRIFTFLRRIHVFVLKFKSSNENTEYVLLGNRTPNKQFFAIAGKWKSMDNNVLYTVISLVSSRKQTRASPKVVQQREWYLKYTHVILNTYIQLHTLIIIFTHTLVHII